MKDNELKLYKITLDELISNESPNYGISYVVAKDLNEAYNKVNTFMTQKCIGSYKTRSLSKIELIAEGPEYPKTKHILFT